MLSPQQLAILEKEKQDAQRHMESLQEKMDRANAGRNAEEYQALSHQYDAAQKKFRQSSQAIYTAQTYTAQTGMKTTQVNNGAQGNRAAIPTPHSDNIIVRFVKAIWTSIQRGWEKLQGLFKAQGTAEHINPQGLHSNSAQAAATAGQAAPQQQRQQPHQPSLGQTTAAKRPRSSSCKVQ